MLGTFNKDLAKTYRTNTLQQRHKEELNVSKTLKFNTVCESFSKEKSFRAKL